MTTSGLGHQVASPAGLKERFIPGDRILLPSVLSSTDLTPPPADPFPERTPALTPAAWGLQCPWVSPRASPWTPVLPQGASGLQGPGGRSFPLSSSWLRGELPGRKDRGKVQDTGQDSCLSLGEIKRKPKHFSSSSFLISKIKK